MKYFFYILFFIQYQYCTAQINVDSLYLSLINSNKYHTPKPVEYLMEHFMRFKSKETNHHFDIYIDSTGTPSEYIGLCAIYEEFDNKNRLLNRMGYNKLGEYYLWDYSPIMKMTYYTDSSSITLYDHKYDFLSQTVKTVDSKNRVVQIVYRDKNEKYYKKTVNEYNDSSGVLKIMYYDINNSLRTDKNGAAIIYRKYNPSNNFLEEEFFYNREEKLIDANHNFNDSGIKIELMFSTVRYKLNEDGTTRAFFFNTKQLLIGEMNLTPPYSLEEVIIIKDR